MAPVRPTSGFLASCLVLAGLSACGRSSREAASVEPPTSAVADEPGSRVPEGRGVAAEEDIALAREWLAVALADGDAAEQARARFALAEACSSAAAGLAVARYALDEERVAGPPGPRRELDRRAAELEAQQLAWLEAAAAEYAALIRSTDPAAVELRPRARLGLAEIQRSRGDHAAMHDTLVALVHDEPDHPLAATAWLLLADEAFGAGRLDEARLFYERVLVFQGHERHYARYKLGWVALGLDDGAAALAHFTSVATEARSDPRQRTLVENAAKDCVIAYARVGRPEKARSFFVRLDPPNAEALVRRLAQIYEDEGRPDDAARALGMARN